MDKVDEFLNSYDNKEPVSPEIIQENLQQTTQYLPQSFYKNETVNDIIINIPEKVKTIRNFNDDLINELKIKLEQTHLGLTKTKFA